jgi:hypothetical protein
VARILLIGDDLVVVLFTCQGTADVANWASNLGGPTASQPRRLAPSREKAYQLYRWALEQNPALADGTDADVYAWLQKDLRVEGEGLPRCCKTFERYLREARAHYDDHKHQPRGGRQPGRSVVREGQV